MEPEFGGKLRPFIEGGAALALAQLLGALRIITFSFGDSVTMAMAPLLLFAVRWGCGPGALLGAVYGIWNLLLRWDWDMPFLAIAADGVLAYAILGIAGLFRGRRYGVFCGALLGTGLRCIVHIYSGLRFRTDPIPPRFLNLTMTSPEKFYILYDGLWMLTSLTACLVLLGIAYRPLKRFFLAEDLLNAKTEDMKRELHNSRQDGGKMGKK